MQRATTVAILGGSGVGKSTFINSILGKKVDGPVQELNMHIFNRQIPLKVYEDKSYIEKTSPPRTHIILYNLTKKNSLEEAKSHLKNAVSSCAMSSFFVIGTHEDLKDQREVPSLSEVNLELSADVGGSVRYYETNATRPDVVQQLFLEIIAIPYINEEVFRATPTDAEKFAVEAMEWCLEREKFEMLAHLHSLGYSLPPDLLDQHAPTVGKYLTKLHPLQMVPNFEVKDLSKDPYVYELSDEEGELYDLEMSMQVKDSRKSLSVTKGWSLKWSDLSLFKCPIELFPSSSDLHANSLVDVDLSHNRLLELPIEIFRLPSLKSLNISFNDFTRLPHPLMWEGGPKILLASHNCLDHNPLNQSQLKLVNSGAKVRKPQLWYADFSYNNFSTIPQPLTHCTKLQSLNMEGNPKMKSVDPFIAGLPCLENLMVSSETVIDPPSFVVSKGPGFLLRHLKGQIAGSAVWNRFRLVLLGPKSSGKSSLVHILKDSSGVHKSNTRKGLVIHELKLSSNEYLRRSWVNLDIWEFEEGFEKARETLYPSFSCHQSVHILVFDVQKQPKSLLWYLADLQAQSPHPLPVMVVFTHVDALPRDSKEVVKKSLRNLIENGQNDNPHQKFEVPDSLLMPNVIGIHFVSLSTLEGIPLLKKKLQRIFFSSEVALNPKEILGLGLSVPKYYLAVDDAVHQIRLEQQNKQSSKRIPLFALFRVQNLIMNLKPKLDSKDVDPALWFLHEIGIICMFEMDDHVYVCLDPSLLAELLVKLIKAVSTKEQGKPKGIHEGSHLKMVWGTESVGVLGVSPQLLMTVLQTSQVFCPISPSSIVTPLFLSTSSPPCPSEVRECLRVYSFDFLPHSLMPKFLCALMKKVVGSIEFSFTTPIQTPTNLSVSIHKSSSSNPETLVFFAGSYEVTIWATGIVLEEGDSGARVEVGEGCDGAKEYSGAVKISVWGSAGERATLLRLTCGVLNETLQKWYPGLVAQHDNFSVNVYIAVSTATSPIQTNQTSRQPSAPHSFMDSLPFTTGTDGFLYYSLYDILKRYLHASEVSILDRTYTFYELVPDYACSDLLSSGLDLSEELSLSAKSDSVSGGYFLRSFPEFQEAVVSSRRKSPDIQRMFHLGYAYDMFHDYLAKLSSLQSQQVVSMLSYSMSPPTLKLERAPYGCLRDLLQQRSSPLQISDIHVVTLQIIAAVEHLHSLGVQDACICSYHILVWNTSPISIKLSDESAPPQPHTCEMCIDPREIPSYNQAFCDKGSVLQLAILLYELATGKRPFEGIFTPSFVNSAILYGRMKLNIEAQLEADNLNRKEASGDDTTPLPITGCQRICLQSIINSCMATDTVLRPTLRDIRDRLCLCVGASPWAPCRMSVSVECVYCPGDTGRVYWASGSRGLIVGHFNPDTGENFHHIILEAPVPSSGMFANRKGKPVPLAVGHATCLTVVKATKQLWVGTENGSKGSLHVFDVTDWSNHHSVHLQDAVLSILALNDAPITKNNPNLRYRVFAGLANGTIIIFTGILKDKVAVLPLQAQRRVIITRNRGPCLHMVLDSDGRLWYSRGDSIEVMDPVSLEPDPKLTDLQVIHRKADLILKPAETSTNDLREQVTLSLPKQVPLNRTVSVSYKPKPEIVIHMAASARGIWAVTRRSTKIYYWDLHTGKRKPAYDVSSAVGPTVTMEDITVICVQGRVLWVGTSSGHILVLDMQRVESGESPLLGLQYCGEGRVKDICPLYSDNVYTSRLRVVCSLEHYNEISGLLMTWEYHHHYDVAGGVRKSASLTASEILALSTESTRSNRTSVSSCSVNKVAARKQNLLKSTEETVNVKESSMSSEASIGAGMDTMVTKGSEQDSRTSSQEWMPVTDTTFSDHEFSSILDAVTKGESTSIVDVATQGENTANIVDVGTKGESTSIVDVATKGENTTSIVDVVTKGENSTSIIDAVTKGESTSIVDVATQGENTANIVDVGTKGESTSIVDVATKGENTTSIVDVVTKGENSTSIIDAVTKGESTSSQFTVSPVEVASSSPGAPLDWHNGEHSNLSPLITNADTNDSTHEGKMIDSGTLGGTHSLVPQVVSEISLPVSSDSNDPPPQSASPSNKYPPPLSVSVGSNDPSPQSVLSDSNDPPPLSVSPSNKDLPPPSMLSESEKPQSPQNQENTENSSPGEVDTEEPLQLEEKEHSETTEELEDDFSTAPSQKNDKDTTVVSDYPIPNLVISYSSDHTETSPPEDSDNFLCASERLEPAQDSGTNTLVLCDHQENTSSATSSVCHLDDDVCMLTFLDWQTSEVPISKNGVVPMPNDEVLIPNDEVPIPNDELPVPNDGVPIPNDELPVPNDGVPIPNDELPVPNDGVPIPNDELPVPNDGVPIPDYEVPTTNEEEPILKDEESITIAEESVPNDEGTLRDEKPIPQAEESIPNDEDIPKDKDSIPSEEEPTPNFGQPILNVQEPFSNVGEPMASVGEPIASVGEPISDVGEPISNGKERVTKHTVVSVPVVAEDKSMTELQSTTTDQCGETESLLAVENLLETLL
jgi:GTPase SAR1 family protein